MCGSERNARSRFLLTLPFPRAFFPRRYANLYLNLYVRVCSEAESKGRAPFLSRNVKVQSISSSGAPTTATAAPSSSSLAAKGAAAAAAAPPTARAAAAGATPPGAVVQSRVVAAVGDGGALTFQQGKEDVVFRPR